MKTPQPVLPCCQHQFYNLSVLWGNDGDYYCDANLGNNVWCPEYDTWEGNKHTMAVTLHTCNGGNGYWDNCDRGGNFFLNIFLF